MDSGRFVNRPYADRGRPALPILCSMDNGRFVNRPYADRGRPTLPILCSRDSGRFVNRPYEIGRELFCQRRLDILR